MQGHSGGKRAAPNGGCAIYTLCGFPSVLHDSRGACSTQASSWEDHTTRGSRKHSRLQCYQSLLMLLEGDSHFFPGVFFPQYVDSGDIYELNHGMSLDTFANPHKQELQLPRHVLRIRRSSYRFPSVRGSLKWCTLVARAHQAWIKLLTFLSIHKFSATQKPHSSRSDEGMDQNTSYSVCKPVNKCYATKDWIKL